MAETIYPLGRPVRVTPLHLEIARVLYERRPFVMGSTPTTQGATIGRVFDWHNAPAYYQIDMLELADAIVPLIEKKAAGRPLDGVEHNGVPA